MKDPSAGGIVQSQQFWGPVRAYGVYLNAGDLAGKTLRDEEPARLKAVIEMAVGFCP